jgi:vacuolar-type H+-ATPase subunit E/Vma4
MLQFFGYISARDHYAKVEQLHDQLAKESDRRYTDLRETDQEAIKVALTSVDKRLSELNQMREVVTTLVAEKITHPELDAVVKGVEASIKAVDDKIGNIDKTVSTSTGHGVGQREMIAWIISAVTTLAAIMSMLHNMPK